MRPVEQLQQYIERIRKRMLASAALRGLAIAAASALAATVVLAVLSNGFAFSPASLTWSRALLFLAVAFAVAFGVAAPLMAISARRAARKAEEAYPQFDQRLMTCVEAPPSPVLDLLARDTMKIAETAPVGQVVPPTRIAGFGGAAAAALALLVWLILAGPGYLGHGAALLWGSTPKNGGAAFYDIQVEPGDKLVRRKASELIRANLIGFQTPGAKLKARYKGTSKWEEVAMLPSQTGASFEFLLASIPEEVDYYIEAGNIRSKQFKIGVVDLPSIKKIRVTYSYPKWTGAAPLTEDPGGDLRAIEGTQADLAIEMDRPLVNGVLTVDGKEIPVTPGEGNTVHARVPIEKDGAYYLSGIESNQRVRLSDDYFIEARVENQPTIRLSRPGRDLKVSPIEEVTLETAAEDDFGLREVTLHYSVNGSAEKTVSMLSQAGSKSASGRKMLALEDFKLIPGDVVSVYATARDARTEVRTDIYFLEAQPFEREYSQAQAAGGGGGGGGGGEENQIAQRQKEIIAATWNEIRDKSGDRKKAQEDAKFLSEVQSKLQAQAISLAQRMKSRQLAGAAESFQAFAKDMEEAAKAMIPATENLKSLKWKEALPHEQQALQHLLRAEARFREIQVAFGQQGGGGGGQQSGRDLESLFDLELDTEKNQYETGQQTASSGDRQREIDEALQKLEQLARRQQELAQQQRNRQPTPEQRWQQEMLRREAEQLQKQMKELAQQSQGQQVQQSQQQGQQSASASGSQSSGSQSGQQRNGQQSATQQRLSSMAGGQRANGQPPSRTDPRIERALEQLSRATEDMRQANQPGQQNDAATRRAAERLSEAQSSLGGMRNEQTSGQLNELASRAERLAEQQQAFEDSLKRRFGQAQSREQQERAMMGQSREQNEQLANEKTRLMEEYKQLEKDLQAASRGMAGSRSSASSKLREALGNAQREELGLKMKYMSEWLRRGLAPYAWTREAPVTRALNQLGEDVREAAQAGGENPGGKPQNAAGQGREQALSQLEQMRQQLERAARGGQRGQPGSPNGQSGQQGQGQQGQEGQQAGNQPGPQGQSGQSGQSGQAGQQGQRGEQGRMGSVARGSEGGEGRPSYGAMNTGERQLNGGAPAPTPSAADLQQMQRAYNDSLRELRSMRQQFNDAPESREEIDRLIRDMQRIDPAKFPGNPALVDRMRTQVIPALEALELQLRRQIEASEGGGARAGIADRMPQGYSDAVAEYFRRLGRAKN